MNGITRCIATVSAAMAVGLSLTGCATPPAASATIGVEPVKLETVGDTGVKMLTLTDKAVERLGITTVAVGAGAGGPATGGNRLVIPYSALLYLPDGTTIAYTNPEGHSYVRETVVVESIQGDQAVLTTGPKVGTAVVTTGGAELWGAEFGIK
jgi:hypothetical protein